MFELLPLIAVLLTPFWGYLLWRRMKSVQRLAREQAAPPKRHIITPVEDKVKTVVFVENGKEVGTAK